MPTALVLIADGSEEMEAVIAIDVLRRGGVRQKSKKIFIYRSLKLSQTL